MLPVDWIKLVDKVLTWCVCISVSMSISISIVSTHSTFYIIIYRDTYAHKFYYGKKLENKKMDWDTLNKSKRSQWCSIKYMYQRIWAKVLMWNFSWKLDLCSYPWWIVGIISSYFSSSFFSYNYSFASHHCTIWSTAYQHIHARLHNRTHHTLLQMVQRRKWTTNTASTEWTNINDGIGWIIENYKGLLVFYFIHTFH